jgi:hypothetical protein
VGVAGVQRHHVAVGVVVAPEQVLRHVGAGARRQLGWASGRPEPPMKAEQTRCPQGAGSVWAGAIRAATGPGLQLRRYPPKRLAVQALGRASGSGFRQKRLSDGQYHQSGHPCYPTKQTECPDQLARRPKQSHHCCPSRLPGQGRQSFTTGRRCSGLCRRTATENEPVLHCADLTT